jgi:hypothetical protein
MEFISIRIEKKTNPYLPDENEAQTSEIAW